MELDPPPWGGGDTGFEEPSRRQDIVNMSGAGTVGGREEGPWRGGQSPGHAGPRVLLWGVWTFFLRDGSDINWGWGQRHDQLSMTSLSDLPEEIRGGWVSSLQQGDSRRLLLSSRLQGRAPTVEDRWRKGWNYLGGRLVEGSMCKKHNPEDSEIARSPILPLINVPQ
jgi:hypothetical protein